MADKADAGGSGKSQEKTLKVVPETPPTDYALLAAWRRLLDYDRVSTEEKTDYKRIRSWVITLGFLTASLAVFSTIAVNNELGFTVRPTMVLVLAGALIMTVWFLLRPLLPKVLRGNLNHREVFNLRVWSSGSIVLILLIAAALYLDDQSFTNAIRIALVILPIASVGLMNYANSFANSVTWVEYRVSAEGIRSNIYQYRMQVGVYAGKDKQECQRLLVNHVHDADRYIDEHNATLPYKHEMVQDSELKAIIASRAYESADPENQVLAGDGLRDMTIHEYLSWRIKPQINWYIDRIKRDYELMRRDRVFALVIAGCGALLSAFGYGLEGLVAVTTAASVALGQRSDIFMYGATYGLFHITSTKLQNQYNLWRINSPQQKAQTDTIRAFVEACEGIFGEERDLWREQAIQKQQMAEQDLQSSINKYNTPPLSTDEDSESTSINHVVKGTVQSANDPVNTSTPLTPKTEDIAG